MPENLEVKAAELFIEPASEITDDSSHVDEETGTVQYNDAASVKLVLDDTTTADNYINIQQWASGWTLADLLYQSPQSQSAFDGGNVGQASVPKYMLSNHISSIVPKLMGAKILAPPGIDAQRVGAQGADRAAVGQIVHHVA